MENKIIKVERNEEDLHHPFVTFSNGKTINMDVGVLIALLRDITGKFVYGFNEVNYPLEFSNEQLFNAYKEGYKKEIEYITSLINGDYSKYKYLTYGQKAIYSNLLQVGVLK